MRAALRATLFLSVAFIPAVACAPTSLRRGSQAAADLGSYCDATVTPGLVSFDGEVATLCVEGVCTVARVGRRGSLEPLEVAGVQLGLGASRGRTVILHDDARLTVLEGGEEIELAAWAADVAVEDDGEHVVFVGLRATEVGVGEQDVEGESPIEAVTLQAGPELGTRLVRLDLDTAEIEELLDDPMAGTPIPIPGSDDVLYVGAPGSVAALMRVAPGGAPRQLTNLEVADVGQDFVPVPLHEVTFLGSRVVYAVADESPLDADGAHLPAGQLWAVDIETGDAELLGEGRFPLAGVDGVVALTDETAGSACAARYLATEGP